MEGPLIGYAGQAITYDLQGNPLTYRTNLLEWEKGRQLKKLTKPDGKTITYTYNANGIRTGKTVGTSKHTYVLDGTKILSESHGAITTYVHYDNEGSVCGIIYSGKSYFFLKNLQGDVIAITDENGEVVARYRYDAWGVCTIVSDITQCDIANVNPFRYRGYYYDRETGLYYLQSRYYDPETGRFINADEVEMAVSGIWDSLDNLFSYCQNCMICYIDPEGYKAKDLQSHLKLKNGRTGKISIQINGNKINIVANFIMFGNLARKHIQQRSYMFWFANGIRKYWQGEFVVFGYRVSLTTTVGVKYSGAPSLQGVSTKYVAVLTYNTYGISKVKYPFWGWGKDDVFVPR